jgi:hypothetical protein
MENKSITIPKTKRNSSQNSYFTINLLIAGGIVIIMIYSGIFSASGTPHPIRSMHTNPVASTGLSRAFSELIRGNYTQALRYNIYSVRIFIFFSIQIIIRTAWAIFLFRNIFSKNSLAIADILIAVLLFLWAFLPLVFAQFNMLT